MQASPRPPLQAWKKLSILPALVSLSVLATATAAQAETLLKATGMLSESSDPRLEDGSLYDTYNFSGSSGQQIAIILESSDFDTYLILLDPAGERIGENDDISRNNFNSRLALVLPTTGTYTIYANSYDATKSGQYDITVRTNDQSNFPDNLTTLLLDPSADCTTAITTVIQAIEANRDIQVLPSVLPLADQYENVPEGKPDSVNMDLSGTATPSVMASSQLIKYVASNLIQNCTSVGAVAFSPTAYSEQRIFGYSPTKAFNVPAEPPIQEFNCATAPPANPNEPIPWGQKRCTP